MVSTCGPGWHWHRPHCAAGTVMMIVLFIVLARNKLRIPLEGTYNGQSGSVSSGDATHMDEIHRLTRVTARGLHLPLQAADKRRRQGTQGQRQVGAGLWTEKVDIVYNRDSASRSVAWLGSSHKTGAASNASLFPRLARAAPVCPGLTQRAS